MSAKNGAAGGGSLFGTALGLSFLSNNFISKAGASGVVDHVVVAAKTTVWATIGAVGGTASAIGILFPTILIAGASGAAMHSNRGRRMLGNYVGFAGTNFNKITYAAAAAFALACGVQAFRAESAHINDNLNNAVAAAQPAAMPQMHTKPTSAQPRG